MSEINPLTFVPDDTPYVPLFTSRRNAMTDKPMALSLPTPEKFDAAYDGALAMMTALRSSPLYPVIRSIFTTPAGSPMARIEVTDEMADQYGEVCAEASEAMGMPAQRRERPFLKAALQKLIEALQDSLAGQGGLGGMLGGLITKWIGDMLNPVPTP